MPVGFYLKTFIRPRFAWRMAERVIRRGTGSGPLPLDASAPRTVARYARCETIVVGAGIAGLTAALEAAETGERVLLCDEFASAPGSRRVRRWNGSDIEQRVRANRRSRSSAAAARHVRRGRLPSRPRTARAVRADRVGWRPATPSPPAFHGNDLPGVAVAPPRPWRRPSREFARTARVVASGEDEGMEHLGRSSRRGPGSSPRSYRRPSWTRCRTRPRRSWTASSSRRAATDACAR